MKSPSLDDDAANDFHSRRAGDQQVVCRKCGTLLQGGSPLSGHCLACLLEPAMGGEEGANEDKRFDHYQLALHPDGTLKELGRGAMGITYRATDTVLGHSVALKVIDASVAAYPEARERFLREARAAARLRHPNVASVFYYGVRKSDGQCFYAMELVEGETLEARVRRVGPLPVPIALEVACQVGHALAAAEAHGLVHRDLKPSNLMLVDGVDTTVKVIDFGLAKAAALTVGRTALTTGGFVGTPAFASPEQFTGSEVDARSDFFSLGATLWYLLCGKPPFIDRAPPEAPGHPPDPPLPLDRLKAACVPSPVIALTRSLLAPNPLDRPQTARELTDALRHCRQRSEVPWRRRHRAAFLGALAVLPAAATVTALGIYSLPWAHRPNAPERSLAILPFEDLNNDRDNAFFTEGVQEDLQASLAKVSSLKVISQNSVLQYRDRAARPGTQQMGKSLGVGYLLEGSVRRWGGMVRVTAQLVDAAGDRQVWAERYDRALNDVFAIQSDLAERITRQLEVKLTAEEKATLNEPPTRDITAYELLLRARDLLYHFATARDMQETLLDGIRLLEEAAIRDPGFVEAYCTAAEAHDVLYRTGLDRTSARRKLAEAALDKAARLRPDLGEVHFARAYHLLSCDGEDKQIRQELEQARRQMPNEARIPRFLAVIQRGRGLWEEALQDMEKAWALDPLSVDTLHDLSWSYAYLHRYRDGVRAIDRGLAAGLSSKMLTLQRARLCFNANGDTGPLHAALEDVGPAYDPDGDTTLTRINVALWDHDFKGAARLLGADAHGEYHDSDYVYPRAFEAGLIARAQGDAPGARAFLETARPLAQQAVHDRPDDAKALSVLAQVDAALGRAADALPEARRAAEMVPISKDADAGTDLAVNLAQVYAWTGQYDLAFQQLGSLVKAPKALDFGRLKLDPMWDNLHGDPRFDDLLSGLAAISQQVN